MGMAGAFLQISQDKLEQLQTDPMQLEEMADEMFGRFRSGEGFCTVDKSWQTIHFLLAGEPWGGNSIEAQAILGGTEIGPDMGYGPARYLDSQQVKQVAEALGQISVEELSTRFDPEALAREDIYAFSAEYAVDELEMAQDYYTELQQFYAKSAAQNDAVLLMIT